MFTVLKNVIHTIFTYLWAKTWYAIRWVAFWPLFVAIHLVGWTYDGLFWLATQLGKGVLALIAASHKLLPERKKNDGPKLLG